MKKLYIIQKYVVAESIKSALKIEKSVDVDEIWLDSDWKLKHKPFQTDDKKQIGFKKK